MNFTLQEELEMSTWSIQDDLDDKTSDDVSLTQFINLKQKLKTGLLVKTTFSEVFYFIIIF